MRSATVCPSQEVKTQSFDPIENVAEYVRVIGADLRHGGDIAAYSPGGDFITMPEPGRFDDAAAYYATLLHEHCHWTGAQTRLARDLKHRFGERGYAAEELTAELGAAFACAQLGLPSTLRHAEYLAMWARVLRDEPRALWTAASAASRAVTFLDGLAGCAEEIAA